MTAHAGLGDYRGVWFFVRGRSGVVSAPPELVRPLAAQLRDAVAEDLLQPDFAARAVGAGAGRIVGPSFQGWLPADRFQPVPSDGVRRLERSESALVEAFHASCPAEDWDQGGIDPAAGDVWAALRESRVLALGQLRPRTEGVVDIAILTAADRRREGHARRLVSAMAQHALSARWLLLYQALLSNTGSVALARSLGFEHYATLVAVRLA